MYHYSLIGSYPSAAAFRVSRPGALRALAAAATTSVKGPHHDQTSYHVFGAGRYGGSRRSSLGLEPRNGIFTIKMFWLEEVQFLYHRRPQIGGSLPSSPRHLTP